MIRVELRQRKRENGKTSLFLDFYPPIVDPKTGKKKRQEFLKLYIIDKPKTQGQRDFNRQVMQTAEEILANRISQIRKADIYNDFEKEKLKIKELNELDFVDYFKKILRKQKGSNLKTWISVQNYLTDFFPNGIKFGEINERVIEEFKDYLLSTTSSRSEKTLLSNNSALSYFNKIKATLRQAFKDGILQIDLNAKISPIKAQETRREYLSIDELQVLVKTPCRDKLLKKAALFSALTGLRFSDIEKLTGREVRHHDDKYYLAFTQKKTSGIETHYISKQAFDLLGEFKEDDSKIFDGLKYSAHVNGILAEWIRSAGINKRITFHNFRHTYATLQLDNGTDIYTVSKLLGHKNVKTTQIYAKVIDEKKRAAADRIQLDFDIELD